MRQRLASRRGARPGRRQTRAAVQGPLAAGQGRERLHGRLLRRPLHLTEPQASLPMLRRHILQPMRQRQAHARRAHRRAHRQGRARRRGEGLLPVLRASHRGQASVAAEMRNLDLVPTHTVATSPMTSQTPPASRRTSPHHSSTPSTPNRISSSPAPTDDETAALRRHAHDPGADANGGRGRVTRARHEV